MKLLQTGTFLLALLVFVSPVFADEHAAEETPPPVKKYAEFTLSGTYADTKIVSTFGTSSTKTLRGRLLPLRQTRRIRRFPLNLKPTRQLGAILRLFAEYLNPKPGRSTNRSREVTETGEKWRSLKQTDDMLSLITVC